MSPRLLIAILLVSASPAVAAPARRAAPPPIDVRNLERVANEFDRVFNQGGVIGVRAHSRRCHKAAAKTRSWSRRDACAAFDLAMAEFDSSASRFPDPYFQHMKTHQADQYRAVSTNRTLIRRRLREVLEAYSPFFVKVMRARIAAIEAEPRN
jgi:hypothetical protein